MTVCSHSVQLVVTLCPIPILGKETPVYWVRRVPWSNQLSPDPSAAPRLTPTAGCAEGSSLSKGWTWVKGHRLDQRADYHRILQPYVAHVL